MPVFTATLGSVSFLSQLFNPDASPFSSLLNQSKHSKLCCKQAYIKRSSSSSSSFYTLRVSASSASPTDAKTDDSEQAEAAVTAILDNSVPSIEIRQPRRSAADWKAARAYKHGGFIHGGRVEGFNAGGLLVRFYSLVGFVPFPQLSPSHSCKEPSKTIHEIAESLVGSILSVKVIQADEESRQLIFSEKEAVWSKFSAKIKGQKPHFGP